MPDWMRSLQKTLADPNIHRNVVLFIVRLMLNLESVFRPYAKLWWGQKSPSLIIFLSCFLVFSTFIFGLVPKVRVLTQGAEPENRRRSSQ